MCRNGKESRTFVRSISSSVALSQQRADPHLTLPDERPVREPPPIDACSYTIIFQCPPQSHLLCEPASSFPEIASSFETVSFLSLLSLGIEYIQLVMLFTHFLYESPFPYKIPEGQGNIYIFFKSTTSKIAS